MLCRDVTVPNVVRLRAKESLGFSLFCSLFGIFLAKMAEDKKKFHKDKHLAYIRKISADTSSFEYLYTQHLRMSGVYWGLCATSLLGIDLKTEASYTGMIQWILSCQDPVTGG